MNYIILASGQSSRMGTDKMFIKVGGSSLIARTLGIINAEDEYANIGVIVSDKISRKWKEELDQLVEQFDIDLIVNQYDNTKTTNSATMCCAVDSMNLSKSEVTVVIDSDIYLSTLDLRRLITSMHDREGRLVSYATTSTPVDDAKEYSINSDGFVNPDDYTGRHILSFYGIQTRFLEQLVAIAKHSMECMREPYFDHYILRALGWKVQSFNLSKETKEFDELEDVIKSGKLSVSELQELLIKVNAEADSKGMSNTTYSDDKLFVKIFRPSTSEIVDRDREVRFHNLFSKFKLAPRLIYSNKDYSASERVVGYHPRSSDIIEDVIKSLEKVHDSYNCEEDNPNFMRSQVDEYKMKCNIDVELDYDIEEFIKDLDASYKLHRCHGDLVAENILVQSDGSIKFIDFEYACIRNKNWDIATLYLELGDEIPIDKDILSYAVAVDYIWYLWSMMKGKVEEYKDYGISRLNRARSNFEVIKKLNK